MTIDLVLRIKDDEGNVRILHVGDVTTVDFKEPESQKRIGEAIARLLDAGRLVLGATWKGALP